MGRTIHKYRDDEDDRRKNKSAKHSKNIPGEGMRVINSWSEENIDDEDWFEVDEYSDDLHDEYNDYISQTQRK